MSFFSINSFIIRHYILRMFFLRRWFIKLSNVTVCDSLSVSNLSDRTEIITETPNKKS